MKIAVKKAKFVFIESIGVLKNCCCGLFYYFYPSKIFKENLFMTNIQRSSSPDTKLSKSFVYSVLQNHLDELTLIANS